MQEPVGYLLDRTLNALCTEWHPQLVTISNKVQPSKISISLLGRLLTTVPTLIDSATAYALVEHPTPPIRCSRYCVCI
ncbi:hypothetical protein H6F96_13310 [Microcoleus sp. FACHB-53]|nr:hypothetical protein [Microcoleus sp. FACHB-53]MBD2130362.1 hypothetical protein [Microcoleus sp. FACHB-1]